MLVRGTGLNAGAVAQQQASARSGAGDHAHHHDVAPSPDDVPGFEALSAGPDAVERSLRAPSAAAARGRWPVKPQRQSHPVRGSFNDPRPTSPQPSYHFGVDVSVNDARPDPAAPRGRTHKIFAIESGRVQIPPRNSRASCDNRKLQVGHFSYWHADWKGTVRDGQYVRAGQHIGWTCDTNWHVHVSEWQWRNGRREWVNPLRPGGKLKPHVDRARPKIHDIEFYGPSVTRWRRFRRNKRVYAAVTGQRLHPAHLKGRVDMRAWLGDRQTMRGWYKLNKPLHAELHPYAWEVTVRKRGSGRVVLRRAYSNERFAKGRVPIGQHYGPGTVQNLPAKLAVALYPGVKGDNEYWFRMFSNGRTPYWDTRGVPNGWYDITIQVRDERGNRSAARKTVRVRN